MDGGPRQVGLEPPQSQEQSKGRRDNQQLPDFNAQIEGEERGRHIAFGQADFLERARKAKAVEQAEQEGDHPRYTFGQARLAVLLLHNLDREEHDGERNDGLHGPLRKADKAKRGADERDRVRNGE